MYFSLARFLLLLTFSTIGAFQKSDVTFYLFTPENREISTAIDKQNVTVDSSTSIIFIIHGWRENHKRSWIEDLRNLLLRSNNVSVIQVDWSRPASLLYPLAINGATKTGEIVGELILHLAQNFNVLIKNIHFYGHSLGAHVAGFAGKYTRNRGFKVGKITALDPAGIFFQFYLISERSRLNRNDADVVVALHTDPWKVGFLFSLGTVDIYPNGRPWLQPGCPDDAGGNWLYCSHMRSHLYIVDALEYPGTLMARRCLSYKDFKRGVCKGKVRDLGGEFNREDEGDYFLNTRADKPYGVGDL